MAPLFIDMSIILLAITTTWLSNVANIASGFTSAVLSVVSLIYSIKAHSKAQDAHDLATKNQGRLDKQDAENVS